MAPETGTALLVLVIFALPGFVTLLIKERTHEIAREVSAFERLLSALYYSLLVYAPLAVSAALAGWNVEDVDALFRGGMGLGATVAAALVTGLALPSLIAYAGHRWLGSDLRVRMLGLIRIPSAHRTPSAWDHMFNRGELALVRATLRDGEVVGGYYGLASFAAYGEHGRDLYLERLWSIDPDTLSASPVENSLGVWLSGDDLVQVELYAVSDEQAEL